ncbi:M67 family metallopeptidase [Sphingomonas baiyangensis]|uniref:M67 family metallopeptidase n=1 Tax=Sphingomonas baiyangensis TaxID=2572576 RepID=A0A4U1L6F2_9SPHN|nr:M67 family metallopeptidase [Sphingomonas baiyangensis]
MSSSVQRLIVAEAQRVAPLEACGLLFGELDRVEVANVAKNVAEDPRCRFEIDPAAFFAALRAERAGGPRIAGWWHSHPSGDARPSATDAAMAAPDGRLWLIVAGEAVAAWRAVAGGSVHGRFDALALRVV